MQKNQYGFAASNANNSNATAASPPLSWMFAMRVQRLHPPAHRQWQERSSCYTPPRRWKFELKVVVYNGYSHRQWQRRTSCSSSAMARTGTRMSRLPPRSDQWLCAWKTITWKRTKTILKTDKKISFGRPKFWEHTAADSKLGQEFCLHIFLVFSL